MRRVAPLAVVVCVLGCLVPGAASAQPVSWNFTQAEVPAAQAPGNDGRGVTVAVIDTWIDGSDTQFGGRVLPGEQCIQGGGTCVPGQTPDSCTHGTHTSGTVASIDYGVAPDADILPVQVLTDGGQAGGACSGSTTDVAAAIDWVLDGGHPRAQVINMSLGDEIPGLTQSSAVTAAVQSAAQDGVVVVIAAGNSSLPFTDSYPMVSGVPSALLVAATGPSGDLASYSNSGGSTSIAAPGGDTDVIGGEISVESCTTSNCVLSTIPGNRTALMEGTSMACPHVAGTAALLLGQDPTRGRVSVIDALVTTEHAVVSGGPTDVLDAAAALGVGRVSPTAVAGPSARASSAPAATTRPGTGGVSETGSSTGSPSAYDPSPGSAAASSTGTPYSYDPSSGATGSGVYGSGIYGSGADGSGGVGQSGHVAEPLPSTGAGGYGQGGAAGTYGFTPVAPSTGRPATRSAAASLRAAPPSGGGVPVWLGVLASILVAAAAGSLLLVSRLGRR
jgi:subtilisin family serine protease